MLKRMGRRYGPDELRRLFRRIREIVPGRRAAHDDDRRLPGRDRPGLPGAAGVRRGDPV
ncbi:MAG: hypothetical protein MZV70_06725 [Desulfobacterales bacterium]|nr:hypothetical protein [Desulfobacterales bacterium]